MCLYLEGKAKLSECFFYICCKECSAEHLQKPSHITKSASLLPDTYAIIPACAGFDMKMFKLW